jgi:Fe-S cluster biogenesis protein NfuA
MEEKKKRTLLKKADEALNEIRPYLIQDGGNVEVVDITDDMTLKITFLGSCCRCSMSDQTFRNGIEEIIRKNLPEIRAVENIVPSSKS